VYERTVSEGPPPPPPRSERKSAERRDGAEDERTGQGFADASGEATEETRILQEQLRLAGVFSGEVDGRYGPATVEAVRRFQLSYGLEADGVAGSRTLEVLASVTGGRGTMYTQTSARPAAHESPVQTSAPEPGPQQTPNVEPVPPPMPAPPSNPVQVILLRSERDAEVVDRLVAAIRSASADVPSRCAAVESLEDPAVAAFDPAALVVPCLSEAFLAMAPSTALLERAGRGGRVLPLLLHPLALANTPFAELPALDGGTALSEWPDPAAWLSVLGRQIAELGQLDAPGRPTSYLPRFSADSLDGRDLLQRREKIEFIASVLAAKELETPLAIGLFGDWGSGKSFFMRRLQERIAELTEASARAAASGHSSLYCSSIRHVMFNAWLHSGSEIWPAFAAEVFRGVGDETPSTPQGAEQQRSLLAFQEWLRKDAERLRTDAERKERIAEIDHELEETRDERAGLVPQVGGPIGKSVGTVYEIGARILGLRKGWRGLGLFDVLLLLLVVAAAVAAYILLEWPPTVIVLLGTGLLGGLRYLDGLARLRRRESQLESEKEQHMQALETGGTPVSPGLLLPEFALREASDWAQRAQLGTVTQIRMKFEQLSRLLAQGVEARARPGALPPDAVPVERVIVYVDDLDRCQPDVVVSVLETLKLLLDLPHFVAVVGVDSRWLFRSLQLHFDELLGAGDEAPDDAWAATPQNYLEKIFQYSLVLRPITDDAFANLIEELLAPPAQSTAHEVDRDRVTLTPEQQQQQQQSANAEPVTTTSAVEATHAVRPTSIDMNPEELVISRAEVEFAKRLAPLFETPRAAKRLANVYRLLRVSVGADDVVNDESYEPVLLLLAIGIAWPSLATDVFSEIRRSQSMVWPAFLTALTCEIRGDERTRLEQELESRSADDPQRDELAEQLNRQLPMPSGEPRLALQTALRYCAFSDVEDRSVATFEPWIDVVAEFSFHPWQEEVLPAG
jgi:peptidoglycan hydrolase-like protein with peptidoglycan-binding domain